MTEVVVYQLQLSKGYTRKLRNTKIKPLKKQSGSLCSQCSHYITDRKTPNGEPLDPICSNPIFSNPRQTLKLYRCKGFEPMTLADCP